MWIIHWIGGLQVELVVNGSDSLAIERIYRERHQLSKEEWLNFMQTSLTDEIASELTEIKERVMLQGRPYCPEKDEAYWKSRGF
ncbi:hypothetical protein [Lactococcus allomyrinae]|uniref:Uncharacterized protein n=1 Tax=Lactococcus allomyrinae TaxID=2419773 RepID=A0A387BF02_9LACT|nr:hypothetical protein [Lactococcus allomyrinae]AYF99675.1 hypothetical protein D7I46_00355 [Lactococcus allomyrinae]